MSVIEAPPTVTPAKQKKQKVTISNDSQSEASKDRGWLVRLYNDPMNKREFVSRCLTEICGLGDGQAYSVMMQAHQIGIAVIGNYPRELAEMYKVKLSGEGLFVDMVPADDN
jgi:ATP-dependent Clp protease adapter protein ClpS